MSRHSLALAFAACALFAPAAEAAVTVTIDKSVQQMTVAVDGQARYHWPVSTGKGAQYDTPSGKFKAFRMERDHFSKEWDDAPMPHSIFFTPKGHAIHGSFETKRLGTAASHGCVRLAPNNAATLFALVKQEGLGNTKVVLTGEAAPMVARRPARSEPQGEPLELQPNQSRAAARPADPQPYGYQPYGTRSGSQQQYAVEPRYRQEYPAQPRSQPEYRVQQRYQQEYAAEPRYREPAYTQPYDRRPAYGQPEYPAYPRYPY